MSSPLGDYELLAKHFGGVQPQSKDIANFILLNSPVGQGGLASKKKGNEPSLMGRIFDILSRGNYASANAAKAIQDADNPFSAFIEGLTGEKKTTYSDVLKNAGVERGFARSLAGFALDVGLDPTSYIPVAGAASKLGSLTKSGKAAAQAAKVLEDVPAAEKAFRGGATPVNPENFGKQASDVKLPEALRGVSKPELQVDAKLPIADPIVAPKPEVKIADTAWPGADPNSPTLPGMEKMAPSTGKTVPTPVEKPVKEAIGQIPLNFPNFKVKEIKAANTAESIVEAVAKGSPEAASKIIPPAPLTGFEPRHQEAAGRILDSWTDTATGALNKKYPDTINPKQQAKLYWRSLAEAQKMFKKPGSPKNAAVIRSHAYKIYSAAVNSLESSGKVFRIDSGENVRLADVVAKLGGAGAASRAASEFVSPKPGSDVWQAIEDLRAGSAISDTPAVKEIVAKVAESKAETVATSALSDAQRAKFDKLLKEFGKATAKTKGVSPAAQKATEQIIDMNLRSYKSAAQIAVEQSSKMLDDIIATGKQNTQTNRVLTKALEKDLGKLPVWTVGDNKAVESVMGRVATWWGQKDLRPHSLAAIGAAKATSTVREQVLSDLFKPYSTVQRHEALKLAQGVGVPSSPEVEKLATEIKRMVDNLVGRASGQSVLMRSAVDFRLLNKWMRRYSVGFEFTKDKQKNILGETVDYSRGTSWADSWKTANITQDPHAFLFKFQQAMEQATREKALFTDLGERFGSTVPGKGYKTKITGHPYLDGYYFTDDIAKQIPRVVRDWSSDVWHPKSPVVGLYDRVMSMWKSGVTIYRPGHHIRNMVGDVYLGWMDGVNSVRPYMLAAKVQKSMHGAYSTISDVDKLVDAGVMSKNFKTPEPNQILFRNRSGVPFTSEQIAAVAHSKGLLEHTNTLEDIIDMGATGGAKRNVLDVKPFGGKVQAVARGAAELQSHNARLAHFIDKVSKSRGTNLQSIFDEASNRARKWHPSGLDMTDFEKKYMRRVMPFYSWMRKALPLVAEGLAMNPGKVVAGAKAVDAIQDYQGIETPGRDDPFPVDQMFPSWMRTEGLGPIGLPDGMLGSMSNQTPPGYVMAGLGINPLTSMIGEASNPGKMLLSGLTPAVQVPIELMSGNKLQTGQPITGIDAPPGAFSQYVGEQVPVWSALQGILGITPTGASTSAAGKSDTAQRQALVNFMTGAGVQGTGPYIKQGRYEKKAPIDAQRKAGKEELLRQLRERYGV